MLELHTAITDTGFSLSLDGEWQADPAELIFPPAVWQAFPDKQALINEVVFVTTLAMPLLMREQKIIFDTPEPRYFDLYRDAFEQSVPNLVQWVEHESSADVLQRFQQIEYIFAGEASGPLPLQSDWHDDAAVLPLSFGKDSLMSLACLRDMDFTVTPVNIDEGMLPRMRGFVDAFIPELKQRTGLHCQQVTNLMQLFNDYQVLGVERSYLYQAQVHFIYHLLMLPFCYYHKAPLVVQSNELINTLPKVHREGFVLAHKVMQSEAMNHRYAQMLEDFSQGQITAVNTLAGVGDYAINALLYRQFPQLADLRVSCHMEMSEHDCWCHDCVRCAHAYLNLRAMGMDPFACGFKHSMLSADKAVHYRVFDDAISEEDLQRRYYHSEELLAFYQAQQHGCDEPLVQQCLQRYTLVSEDISALQQLMFSYQYQPQRSLEKRIKTWFDKALAGVMDENHVEKK